MGGDELLHADGNRHSSAYVALRTLPTNEFAFAVVGSMKDPARAELLAAKYSRAIDDAAMLAHSIRYWSHITRGLRIGNSASDSGAKAIETIFPWLVHDAMVHLTVPHGLEQYTGAAWGTRDVCQGPMELFLTLGHDEPAKAILRIVFAQQYEKLGSWPQWFMLEPYSGRAGQAGAWRCHYLAVESFMRLCGSDRRFRHPRRTYCMAARRRFRKNGFFGSDFCSPRQIDRNGASAICSAARI